MGEEEVGKHYTGEGYLFVVDPIDGTTNFIKGYHASTISVGLLKDGEPVLGVVYNPYRDEMYTAEKGKGAYLNGEALRVSEDTLSESLVAFGTAPYYEELWERSFNLAQVFFTQSLDVRRSGSATIDLCDVAFPDCKGSRRPGERRGGGTPAVCPSPGCDRLRRKNFHGCAAAAYGAGRLRIRF